MATATVDGRFMERIGARKPARWGIGTAAPWVESWRRATGGDETKDEAATCQPVYYAKRLLLSNAKRVTPEDVPGSCMVFDATITSSSLDRDRDVLEPSGAKIDAMLPLLWQHDSAMPIGKLLEVVKQNNKRIVCRFAIADTPLGREVAKLIEFGAIRRVSVGFIPDEDGYEEMHNEAGQWTGWHVTGYEIVEVSLVSVASQRDAIVGDFSQTKFANIVNAWQGGLDFLTDHSLYAPSKVVNGSKPNMRKAAVPYKAEPPADEARGWDAAAAVGRLRTWSGVTEDEPTAAAWSKYRRGFTFVRGDGDAFGSYILPHHDVIDGEIVTVWRGVAAAMAAIRGGRGGVELPEADLAACESHLAKHYAQFDKEPPEKGAQGVGPLTTTVDTKAGRVLSKANESLIREAAENCGEIVTMEGVPRAAKALARTAKAGLEQVLAAVAQDEEPDKAGDSVTYNAVLAWINLQANKQVLGEVRDAACQRVSAIVDGELATLVGIVPAGQAASGLEQGA